MFPDGWICRACWKPNRAGDDRCYACKTPREEQLVVAAGSKKEAIRPGIEKRARLDSDLGIVAILVAWPMLISGWLLLIAGAFTLFLALIAGERVTPDGVSVRLLLIGFAVGTVLIGMLYIFLSRSVRRQARWAYAIAALGYGVPALISLMWAVPVPTEVNLPDWYVVLETVLQWVYLVLGLMAVLLLAASFMRDDSPEQGSSVTTAP